MKKGVGKIWIGIPCLSRGGTEMQTLLLARALIELGYKVEVCGYFESDQEVVREFQSEGAFVRLLNWPRSIGPINFIRSLSQLIRKTDPSAVHVQYMTPGLLPIIAAKLARVPAVIATVHQPGTPHSLKNQFLLRLAAQLVDYFTCVSEAAEKSWLGSSCLLDPDHPERIKGRRHFTIPNAVDLSRIDRALEEKNSKVIELESGLIGKMIVGTVARLSREKGIDILVRAFAEIHKALPGAHLLVVGDGSEMTDLQALAGKLGIGNAVTWTGQLPWGEAIGCMGMMDLVAVPSRFEGFGLTAAEAMACGKPVVASRIDGLADLIQDGVTGYLIRAEDSSVFAAAIITLLKDERSRVEIGHSVKIKVQSLYSYAHFLNRVHVLYKLLDIPRMNS